MPTNEALCNALTNGLLTRLDGPFAIAVDAAVEHHRETHRETTISTEKHRNTTPTQT